MLTSRIYP